jgi:hypothetical protein
MAAITKALRGAGVTVRETYDRVPSEQIVFVWSLKWAREIWAVHPNAIICVCDHGLFHPRNRTVVTGWMSLNGWGEHPVVDDGGERLRRTGWQSMLQPWRPKFRYARKPIALVMGQCYNDVQILGHHEDYGKWLQDRAAELADEGFDVRFRPHPVQARNDLSRYPNVAALSVGVPLYDALEPVECVLGYNSNSLLDAFMYGIEDVRIYNTGSMLWPIGYKTRHGYHAAEPTKRQKLAERLAFCQWDPEEIANGEWLSYHRPIVDRLIAGHAARPWHTTEVPE